MLINKKQQQLITYNLFLWPRYEQTAQINMNQEIRAVYPDTY